MIKTAVSEYGFINARLRARLSKMLTDDFKSELINADNVESAVQVLSSNNYTQAYNIWNNTGDIQSIEFELLKKHIEDYRLVIRNTNENLKTFAETLSLKPEIENIKNIIRLWYGSKIKERAIGYRSAYIYKERINQKIDWNKLINAENWEAIQNVFDKTIYAQIFNNNKIDSRTDTVFNIEISMDRLYYSKLLANLALLKKQDAKIVKKIISTEIDLQNISRVIRYKYFYNMDESDIKRVVIPGGHGINIDVIAKVKNDESFQPSDLLKKQYPELASVNLTGSTKLNHKLRFVEQLLDEIRQKEFNKLLCGYPFSIGIMLVYLFMSEREYKFISSVLNAKYYKIPANELEEYIL